MVETLVVLFQDKLVDLEVVVVTFLALQVVVVVMQVVLVLQKATLVETVKIVKLVAVVVLAQTVDQAMVKTVDLVVMEEAHQ